MLRPPAGDGFNAGSYVGLEGIVCRIEEADPAEVAKGGEFGVDLLPEVEGGPGFGNRNWR